MSRSLSMDVRCFGGQLVLEETAVLSPCMSANNKQLPRRTRKWLWRAISSDPTQLPHQQEPYPDSLAGNFHLRTCCDANSDAEGPSPSHAAAPSAVHLRLRRAMSSGAGVAAGAAFHSLLLSVTESGSRTFRGGGGGGGGGGGWWGDHGGGGGGGSMDWGWESMAYAKDWDGRARPYMTVDVGWLLKSRKYKCTKVDVIDSRGKLLPPTHAVYKCIRICQGRSFTRRQLEEAIHRVRESGFFQSIRTTCITQPKGGIKIVFDVVEIEYQPATSCRFVNVGPYHDGWRWIPYSQLQGALRYRRCSLPPLVEQDISAWLRKQPLLTQELLSKVRDKVERWYHDRGYALARVKNFDGLHNGNIVINITEGDITRVQIQYQDRLGHVQKGSTKLQLIKRELPEMIRVGKKYNVEASKRALQNVFLLQLFDNVQVQPRPDEMLGEDGGVIVDVVVRERRMTTAEVEFDWPIHPTRRGWPNLLNFTPGGSFLFEHRNIAGMNRSVFATLQTRNLLSPEDDLGFKLEYVQPYLDGLWSKKDRTLRLSCFNSRGQCAAFVRGPGLEEVPTVWVDRVGVKANITENYGKQSRFTYGLVFQEVATRDETGATCTHGSRMRASGASVIAGPPTGHSDTGVDRLAVVQVNFTRDATRLVNGTPVGSRDIFQLDQGLGVTANFPVFNRHQLTATRFYQLVPEIRNANRPPPVAVIHGRYGGCVGDLASYDAFVLGGPYSVRGYSVGELGVCRHFLELATELRVPVPFTSTHVYGFAEYGMDLGSSKDVRGNPTAFFQRKGRGGSIGLGLKLGSVRLEYAVDCNAGLGSYYARFGERF